jgi:hypothetical protein
VSKDDKRIVAIAIAILLFLITFFALAPDMKERTKAIQAYQQPKEQKKKVVNKEFYSVLVSWTERDGELLTTLFYVNNLKKDIKTSRLQCMTFDNKNQLLDTLEKNVKETIPKHSSKKVSRLEIGEISPRAAQVGCKTIGYK